MRPTDKSKVISFDKKVAANEKMFQEQQQNRTLEFHIQNQKRQARSDKAILALMARQ